MRRLLVVLLGWLLIAPVPAAAQAGLAGRAVATCVMRATPGMTVRRAFAAAGSFDCTTRQTAFGVGDFWVRSAALPATLPADRPLAVRTGSLWQAAVTLYALYPDGRIVRVRADDRGVARALQLGAIVEQRLPDRGLRPVRLVWHVTGAANLRGIVNGARIATPAESARSNLEMGAIYAAFAGFAAALLIHNLAIWRALRQRFQLYYVAMLAGLLVYALSSSGALAWLCPDLPNTARLRVNYLTLAWCAVAAIGFARTFFEPRIFAGWVGRTATAVAATIAGAAILFAIAAPWRIGWLDALYSTSFLGLGIVVAPVLWRAWATRSDYRWLFGLAWAAPIVVTTIRVAHNFDQIGWSFWLDNSTLLSMTLEALISSMAIAYRVRLIAQERDTARAEELAQRLLADTDPLTGLLNRRAFLGRAIGRADAQRLLVLDIDHFKRVNDTIGHDGGDEVLRRFARVLRAATPAAGLAARLGGEEFAVLVPAADPLDPNDLVARLRDTRMPFDLLVTTSIGGCDGPLADEADWKALYRAADRALFEAKAAGRDRARFTPAYALAA